MVRSYVCRHGSEAVFRFAADSDRHGSTQSSLPSEPTCRQGKSRPWNGLTAGDQPLAQVSVAAHWPCWTSLPQAQRQRPRLHPPQCGPCTLHPGVPHAWLKPQLPHDANHNHHQPLFSNLLGQETRGAHVSSVWGPAMGESTCVSAALLEARLGSAVCHHFFSLLLSRFSSLLLRFGFNPTCH